MDRCIKHLGVTESLAPGPCNNALRSISHKVPVLLKCGLEVGSSHLSLKEMPPIGLAIGVLMVHLLSA